MPKKPRSKRLRSPLWARTLVAVGAALALTGGGTAVAGRVLVGQATHAVQKQNLLGAARDTGERRHAQITGAKNILLVGLDTRPSWANKEPSRSDSIILLHIPADHSEAYLISLPRDSYVAIPAYDNGAVPYGGGRNKINSAFAFGSRGLSGAAAESHGFELLALTVKKLTGITQVMQVLGQVCMDVDEDVTSIHVGHTADGRQAVPYRTDEAGLHPRKVPGVTANFYAKGNHCFTPAEALDFARQRDLLALKDSDYGRQRHQQQLLKAILKQAVQAGLNTPTKLPRLLSAMGRAMTVDDGGIALEDWAFAMRGINPDQLVTLKSNKGKFNSRSVGGIGSVEILDATTMTMLRAAKTDGLAAFVQQHPDVVAQS